MSVNNIFFHFYLMKQDREWWREMQRIEKWHGTRTCISHMSTTAQYVLSTMPRLRRSNILWITTCDRSCLFYLFIFSFFVVVYSWKVQFLSVKDKQAACPYLSDLILLSPLLLLSHYKGISICAHPPFLNLFSQHQYGNLHTSILGKNEQEREKE